MTKDWNLLIVCKTPSKKRLSERCRKAQKSNCTFDMCAQWWLKSACASAQSDQSVPCSHDEILHFWSDSAYTQTDLSLDAHVRRYVFWPWPISFRWLLNGADITKTCLHNFDPLKPHFYTVKLEFTGVYIIFLISAKKHRLWVLVRTVSPRRF